MSSTNHTTNYNLPQFVGSDKPAWLGDINPAMSAIDTAMHANAVLAQQGIDDASTAKTTADTAEGHAQDAITSAGTAQETANGAIASLSQTNTKLNDFIESIVLTDFQTCNISLQGTTKKLALTLAQSADGKTFKIYGVCQISNASGSAINPFGAIRNASNHIKTGLYLNSAPETAYEIIGGGMVFTKGSTALSNNSEIHIYVEADGEITFDYWGSSSIANNTSHYLWLVSCLYFNTNFGDTPDTNA